VYYCHPPAEMRSIAAAKAGVLLRRRVSVARRCAVVGVSRWHTLHCSRVALSPPNRAADPVGEPQHEEKEEEEMDEERQQNQQSQRQRRQPGHQEHNEQTSAEGAAAGEGRCTAAAAAAGAADTAAAAAAAAATVTPALDGPMQRRIATLMGAQLLMSCGYGCVAPVLPCLAAEMGVGAAAAGALLSAPALTRLALNMQVRAHIKRHLHHVSVAN
jgi:hypothetical protein